MPSKRCKAALLLNWVTIRDLDEDEIQATLQNAIALGRMKKPVHTDLESILRGLGLFDDGHLVNAAVALYGKSERLFASYPQLTIRLARFRGTDRLSGFMDNRNYWGNGFDLARRGEWNPIIASVFYRAGVIEKWGMGTLNIIDWCKENGNPKPTWEIRAESVVTTFLPSSFFSTGKSPEEQATKTKKARPESLENAVLNLIKDKPLSKGEISQALGHKHISGGLKKVLLSLLKQEKITYTIPEKPNSRLQKYKLNK